MNRRRFLQAALLTSGTALVGPILVSCGGIAAKAVLHWFIGFMTAIGANVVADSINDWKSTRSESERDIIDQINTMMRDSGFTDSTGRKVYERNGVYCYEFGHEDKFNGCSPFFSGIKGIDNIPLAEGPTVMALALAAEELRDQNDANTLAQSLVPMRLGQKPDVSAFGKSYDKEFVALTDFGSVVVDYANTGSNTGTVTIALANRQGEQVLGRQYDIKF